MFADRQWPEGLSGKEIDDMVTEHYKEHSIYLKCDGRQNVETLLPAICEEMKRCDEEQKRETTESIKAMLDKAESMQLHLVKIPSVFNDVNGLKCGAIAKLLESNIAGNVDERLLPYIAPTDNGQNGL